jgi:uncharacterized protein YdaU (DUF1376 family)
MTTKARLAYVKFYFNDYFEATRGMTLEERGAYMDIICLEMQTLGKVPDDDKWMAHQLHVSARKWRSLKPGLEAQGKIRCEGGLIIQDRCLQELDRALSEHRLKSGSALTRERLKREPTPNQRSVNDEKFKKHNEINGRDTTVVPLRARVSESDTDKERKEPPLSPPIGALQNEPAAQGQGGQIGRVAAAVAASLIAAATPLAAEPTQPSLFGQAATTAEASPAEAPAPSSRGRGKKARLPADWKLPVEWRAETREKFGVTDFQINRQTERFVRYWTSADCKNPLKADWKATWLNWIDNQQARGYLGPAGPTHSTRPGAPQRRVVIVDGQELLV